MKHQVSDNVKIDQSFINKAQNVMSDIKFTATEQEKIIAKIQTYFESELDQEIGQFDAGFLLSFFAEQIGGHFYNKGLEDAREILNAKVATIDDELYAIEKVLD